eukprot:6575485-Alexandrium_andersonii.AAC.1
MSWSTPLRLILTEGAQKAPPARAREALFGGVRGAVAPAGSSGWSGGAAAPREAQVTWRKPYYPSVATPLTSVELLGCIHLGRRQTTSSNSPTTPGPLKLRNTQRCAWNRSEVREAVSNSLPG